MSHAMSAVALLRAACCVAGADGLASESEQRLVKRLADGAGVGLASLSAMIELAQTDKDFYEDQFRVLKPEPKLTMELLFKVAAADGRLREDEVHVLRRLSQRLEVSSEQFDAWLQQAMDFVQKKTGGKDGA